MAQELAWEWLQRQPYYTGLWDTALVRGERAVVFLLRIPRREAEKWPERVPAHWKAGIMTYQKVFLFIVMVRLIPFDILAEYWFNYIHPDVKEAVSLLATQPYLYLPVYDVGPIPVRLFVFPNGMKFDIVLMEKALKEAKPWTDPEFDAAKAAIQAKYTIEELWEAL